MDANQIFGCTFFLHLTPASASIDADAGVKQMYLIFIDPVDPS